MTLNGVTAIILRYFAEFSSFRGVLHKSGWLAINRFFSEKCCKVHQARRTCCALRGSGASCFLQIWPTNLVAACRQRYCIVDKRR